MKQGSQQELTQKWGCFLPLLILTSSPHSLIIYDHPHRVLQIENHISLANASAVSITDQLACQQLLHGVYAKVQ